MQQTPPTKEDLKNMGLDFLEIAKAQLKTDHNILPVIKLGDAIDGAPETVIAIVGPAMNDRPAKTEISKRINGMIAEHGYMHAIVLVDTNSVQFQNDEEMGYFMLARRILGMERSFEEIHRITGVGTFTEMLLLMVQTISGSIVLRTPYTRNEDGKVTWMGETEEGGQTSGRGRFVFFGEHNES